MKPFDLLAKFWEWVTQCRSASIMRERLALQEQQSRAEIFALRTAHEQETNKLEAERDELKAQVARIEADHALTKNILQEA
jgi:hypothetical protein